MLNRFTGAGTLAALSVLFMSPALAQQGMPPKQVGVVEMTLSEVPRVIQLPGRAVASEETAIRPRVSGIITKILYQPGTALEPGAPMFAIDPMTYEAAVVQAEAKVVAARSAQRQALLTFERTSKLAGSGTTQAEVENARAALEQAEANMRASEAALRIAEAELGWTTVTSPIAGMASVAKVSVGDLVSAGQATALATVTRLDPIEVDMYEPSAKLQQVYDDIASGRLRATETLQASLTLENGQIYEAVGELVAPGFSVSTSTGSVDTRFRFENPEGRLLPGMFLRGKIELGSTDAYLVSQSAARRDRTGKLTAFVVENGKSVQRVLQDDGTFNHHWIIIDGLNEGDQLIVDGLSNLAAGMDVVPVPVEFDDKGVARTAAIAGAAKAAPESPAEAAPEATPAAADAAPSEAASSEVAPGEAAPKASPAKADAAPTPADAAAKE